MADRPDFTYLADTDIIAQTIGNVAVNIAAQTLATLGINITAQDLAELIIKINAQAVGIYLQPEWAALQGKDKNFRATGTNKATGTGTLFTYTVPDGKTLYVCGVSFYLYATTEGDRDLNQIGFARLINDTTSIRLASLGGNGGNGLVFPKPIVVPENEKLDGESLNGSNHNCNMDMTAWGYEI